MEKYKTITIREKETEDEKRTIRHYISTNEIDRDGEVVIPEGCEYEDYMKNPVVFINHNRRELPIMKCEKLIIERNGIIAETRFDETEKGKEMYRLNKEGYLNAWSIGFRILTAPEQKEGISYINKWSLLEYSNVTIPSNPGAVNIKELTENSEIMKMIEDEMQREKQKREIEELIKIQNEMYALKMTNKIESEIKELEKKIVRLYHLIKK